MLEPPADLSTRVLREALERQYGLEIADVAFLPLGHDALAWVYRAGSADGTSYFLKVRRGALNEAALLVPHFLQDSGVRQVVAPLATADGALWTEVEGYKSVLYPFVNGTTGKVGGMSPGQWSEYGSVLRQIHETPATAELAEGMRKESFRPQGAEMVRELDTLIREGSWQPPADSIAAFWQERREQILSLVDRAEELGRLLARRGLPFVICHADIHTNNVLVDEEGRIWIADWDETVLAPRERDLMFAMGGGISEKLVTPSQEAYFLEGYGEVSPDPLALAFYRYAWAVSDIAAYGEQVFARPDLGAISRQEGVERFLSLFGAGEIVELAIGSEGKI